MKKESRPKPGLIAQLQANFAALEAQYEEELDLCTWTVDYTHRLARTGCDDRIVDLTDAMLESDHCPFCMMELANVHVHTDITQLKRTQEGMAKEMHDRNLEGRDADGVEYDGHFDMLTQEWVPHKITKSTLNAKYVTIINQTENKEAILHSEICKELTDTFEKKNQDYGNSFERSLDKHGLRSAIIRMEDKMNRLDALSHTTKFNVDESLQDTLLDLANYAIMTKMWLDTKGGNK